MKIQSKISAQEIRTLNLSEETVLGFEFQWCDTGEGNKDHNFIVADGKRILAFDSSRNQRKAYDKIRKMGLGWGWKTPQFTDEEQGIIQAAGNGENPFAYSIICSNPEMNEVVK